MNRSIGFRIIAHFGLVYFFVFFTLGCTKEQFKTTSDVEQFQKKYQAKEREFNKREAKQVTASTVDSNIATDYILGAGDLITVSIFETPDLNAETRVSSRGSVTLPLLNNVQVAGLTAAEAERKIEEMYRRTYLHDPHVTIYIKEHVSKQITLVGALKKPGTYDYVSKRRLLDVIAIAEGLQEKAGTIAYINRQDPKTQQPVNYAIDLNELIKKGNMQQNLVIQGGDVIFIPESGQVFIDGAVRKPGTYPVHAKMTVTEGIAMAGGLASYANEDRIKLIRYMGEGKDREIISLSYSDLQGGQGDKIILEDQDIIFAESSTLGRIMSGTGVTLGFMGTGINFKDPKSNN